MAPDLVLLVFLPPLLYAAAFFADLHACASTGNERHRRMIEIPVI